MRPEGISHGPPGHYILTYLQAKLPEQYISIAAMDPTSQTTFAVGSNEQPRVIRKEAFRLYKRILPTSATRYVTGYDQIDHARLNVSELSVEPGASKRNSDPIRPKGHKSNPNPKTMLMAINVLFMRNTSVFATSFAGSWAFHLVVFCFAQSRKSEKRPQATTVGSDLTKYVFRGVGCDSRMKRMFKKALRQTEHGAISPAYRDAIGPGGMHLAHCGAP